MLAPPAPLSILHVFFTLQGSEPTGFLPFQLPPMRGTNERRSDRSGEGRRLRSQFPLLPPCLVAAGWLGWLLSGSFSFSLPRVSGCGLFTALCCFQLWGLQLYLLLLVYTNSALPSYHLAESSVSCGTLSNTDVMSSTLEYNKSNLQGFTMLWIFLNLFSEI